MPDTAADRPHLTEITFTGRDLENISKGAERLLGEADAERAPIRRATDQFLSEVAAMGPRLTDLGPDFEGEVVLRCKVSPDKKSGIPVATARVERPTIRSTKQDSAFESSRIGENQGQAVLALFDA